MEENPTIWAKNEKTHHIQVGFEGVLKPQWLLLALVPAIFKEALIFGSGR